MTITPRHSNPLPAVAVIVPVRDAETLLPELFDQLFRVLDDQGQGYEVVFVEHGSRDRSPTLLHQQHRLRPGQTRVLFSRAPTSEAQAILAGLTACQGERAIVFPAQADFKPEAIPRLLARMDLGHDFVAGFRSWSTPPRWLASLYQAGSWLRHRLSGVRIRDLDAGLFGFERHIITSLTAAGPHPLPEMIPVLAYQLARDPGEVEILVEARRGTLPMTGRFERAYRHLNLTLGPSGSPLRIFSLLAMSLGSLALAFALPILTLGLLTTAGIDPVLLIGLMLTAFVCYGFGLFAIYLDRLAGNILGDQGFPLGSQLKPKGEGTRPDD